MNYLDNKHYIIILKSSFNKPDNIIKHYIVSDNYPLENKNITNTYIPMWKYEFFCIFGDCEDTPKADIYAEEYGIFGKEFEDIYKLWLQKYLNSINIECIPIIKINKSKIKCFNKQNWIKI